ncbi:MAG: hypothetical protein ACI9H8_001576 [Lysobacterales bacterium]|jgi:hypothetical protein
MKIGLPKSIVSSLIVGLLFSSTTLAKTDFPEVTEDGLNKIKETKHSVVYAKDDVDLSVYDKVYLVDASIAFKKNWKRDQNRSYSHKVSDKDMERIRTDLAELFKEVFTEQLTAAGHELVDVAGDDVLIVRPAILNLDVNAPDTRSVGRSKTFVESAGEMTLYVELYDSVTNDLIVKAMDGQADRQSSTFQWQTKGSNRQAAKKMLTDWADRLSNALNDARGSATTADEVE